MSKFINLDELNNTDIKTFTFQGKEYPIKKLTVGDFITLSQKRAIIEDATEDNANIADMFDVTMEIVRLAVPTMEDKVIESMTAVQLTKLAQFIQEQDTATQEVTEEMGN